MSVVCCLIALPIYFAAPTHAATFVVNTTVDSNDGSCGVPCSLRDAIHAAKVAPGEDTITFSVNGTFTTNSPLGYTSNSGLTIIGNGAANTLIDGNHGHRILALSCSLSGTPIHLSELTILNGRTSGSNQGAGIYNSGCGLKVTNSTISGNEDFGLQEGGGIYNQFGTVTVIHSIVADNIALGGGGIYSTEGSVTVLNSYFRNNTGQSGAGILVENLSDDGKLTVTNSTFSLNGQTGPSTAIYADGGYLSVLVTNSTIVNSLGSGLDLEVGHSTLDNTIVANNNGLDCIATKVRNSLIGDGSCGVGTGPTYTNGNLSGDPMLGSRVGSVGHLPDIYGTPGYFPLLQASPAIDAGDNSLLSEANVGANFDGNYGLTNTGVLALAIDPMTPDTLYAGLVGGGVAKSTDGGMMWSPVNSGIPTQFAAMVIKALAIDPSTPSTLYAGSEAGFGVFKSTDGGTSWSAVNSGLTSSYVQALAIDPMTPATLYAGTGDGGVFESTNGATSWSAVNSGIPSTVNSMNVQALAVDPSTPDTLYAGTSGDGVFKSTDGGTSWNPVNSGIPNQFNDLDIQALAIDPMAPDTLYDGTYGRGVFKSTNGGTSWSPVSSGLGNADVRALAIDPMTPDTLYAGISSSGVFKSTDGGTSWSAASSGLPNTLVQALAIDPTTPDTLYAGTDDGVFKSTNGAASWSPVNGDQNDTLTTDEPGNPRVQGSAVDMGAMEVRQGLLSLTVGANGSASASSDPLLLGANIDTCRNATCSASYYTQDTAPTITLSATPDTHYHVVWSGDCAGAGTNPTAMVTMDVDRTCGVSFSSAHTIGGTVSGLTGTGLVLQDNGGDDLPISADGPFTFSTPVDHGSTYDVTVGTQPTGQVCTVTSGSGTVGYDDVTDVIVSCINASTIGGTVSGLAGTGLVLQDEGGDDLPISADGAFTFSTPIVPGNEYAVTVSVQPSDPVQTCTVANGTGTVGSGDVTDVAVSCVTPVIAIPALSIWGAGALSLLLILAGTWWIRGRSL